MDIASVSEIRQNPARIIARAVRTGRPVAVVQRSKRVAYIVDAASFEDMQKRLSEAERVLQVEETKAALEDLASLRASMPVVTGDAVAIIREMREGREGSHDACLP